MIKLIIQGASTNVEELLMLRKLKKTKIKIYEEKRRKL